MTNNTKMHGDYTRDEEESDNISEASTSHRTDTIENERSRSEGEAFEDKIISKKEQRAVSSARRFVVLVFICCAVAVSISVYFFTANSDQSNFEIEVRKILS